MTGKNIGVGILVVLLGVAGYFVLAQKFNIFNAFEVSRIRTETNHKVLSSDLNNIESLFQKNGISLNDLQIVDINVSENFDKTTTFHIKANQFYRGLSIFQDWVAYHIEKTGEIESITGQRINNLNISIDPKISEYEAVKVSRSKMVGGHRFTAELGIYHKRSYNYRGESIPGDFVLAWEIHTDNEQFPSQIAYVDANSGELLSYFNGIVF